MKGLIHIYCGDGKGKTTAATGLAVRAAGTDMKVLFARFLKNEESGELKILDGISNIEVLHLEKSYGFYSSLSDTEQLEMCKMYEELWRTIQKKVTTGDYDMLVMDEIMAAMGYDIIEEKEVLEFLEHKPEKLEVVMTGRNPSVTMIEKADYVSEVGKIKHPFDKKTGARKGIEY